ncbi:MAG: sulfide:quinone reductase [Bacteroidetes bacterium 4484_276]|nr:MAG: sulfide:quinone reductase [Bacteroidetes bacterium 4484_276]
MKNFIVLGGGFAGVEAAIKLRKYGYRVTLVSDRDYLFVYPISIWVPVKKKAFDDVKIPLAVLQKKHGFDVIVDAVTKIDVENNSVILSKGTLTYDYLFIAMGMHKVKTKGLEFTHSICGHPEEAVTIREELDKLVQRGHGKIAIGFGGNPIDPTATAVRGGPAFELLFNFSHYLKKKGLRDKFEITFFAPMKEPGKRMGAKAMGKMDVFFKHYHIEKQVGKKIKGFEEDAVVFADGEKLESDLIIYISGGDGHKVIKESKLPLNAAGFIKINELCRVEGHRNIYAIGDIAEITGHDWAAKQGHIAEVMADVSTYNVHNELIGKGKRKSYWEKLHIICVMDSGDGAAFVMRNHKRDMTIPLPIIGHWMKKAWGFYYKNSKLKRMPRIPGM